MRKLIALIFVISLFTGVSQNGLSWRFNALCRFQLGAYPGFTNIPAFYMGVDSITNDNYLLLSDGKDAVLNAPKSNSFLYLSKGNGSFFCRMIGDSTGGLPPSLTWRTSHRLNLTAGSNPECYQFNGYGTHEWAAGPITTFNFFSILPCIASATGASTLTDFYSLFTYTKTAGTNLSVINKWGLGTQGSAHITNSIVVGRSARTPVATMDITGTMSVSLAATISEALTTPSINIGTGKIYSASNDQFYNTISDHLFAINGTSFARFNGSTTQWINGAIHLGSNTTANSSSVVEITSTTKGFLPPRMTAAQGSAISSPAEGLLIYVTDTDATFTSKGWWGWSGAGWEKLNN